jgi:hypothetical protein
MRQTSIDAYNAIKENGLLSDRRFEVYDVLYQHGPLTQLQLASIYFPKTQPRNVQPRVSELVALGVVCWVGNTLDTSTHQTNMLWDVTDKLPLVPMKSETRAHKILRLESENAELRRINADLVQKLNPGQKELF